MASKNGINGREVQYHAEISRRVENLRTERRARRSVLARAARMSQQMLRAYEVGRTRWPVWRLVMIADFFDVPVTSLIPAAESCVKEIGAQRELLLGLQAEQENNLSNDLVA